MKRIYFKTNTVEKQRAALKKLEEFGFMWNNGAKPTELIIYVTKKQCLSIYDDMTITAANKNYFETMNEIHRRMFKKVKYKDFMAIETKEELMKLFED